MDVIFSHLVAAAIGGVVVFILVALNIIRIGGKKQ